MAVNVGQVISNAGSGAATGASIGGPWGALIGGAAGGLSGIFGDDPAKQRAKAMRKYKDAMDKSSAEYAQNQQNILNPYGDLYTTGGVKQSLSDYTDALTGANPGQYKVNAGDYTKQNVNALSNWQHYLDPSIKYQQESARKNIEESAAGQGGLYSGSAANEIAANVANIASTGYSDAYNKARQAGMDVNDVAQQNLLNQMTTGKYNVDLGQTNIGNLGTAYGTQQGLMDTYSSGMSDLNKTKLSSAQSLAQTNLGAAIGETGGPSTWDSLIGGVGQAQQAGMFNKSFWGL